MDSINLDKVIKEYGILLTKRLEEKAPVQSGKLSRSFSLEVVENGFSIYGAPYALIVDQGINGTKRNNGAPFSFGSKKPPISALTALANKIGASPWALQKSIFENGFKGNNFATDSINDTLSQFVKDLAEALWQDFYDEQEKNNK